MEGRRSSIPQKVNYRHKIGFIIESLTSVETNAYVQMAATEMRRLRGEEVKPYNKIY